ncbi:hypothetical protein MMC24_005920 [Lignoscripta atroalba]|nr:hypothetical protein [Lignoscripta atroalba]
MPSKSAAPRLKVVVRRLPPGLTQTEFEVALGTDWNVGGRKVDWANYKPGKISKEYCSGQFKLQELVLTRSHSPAKPSKPARAYLHLSKQEYLNDLSEKVKDTHFDDAKASGSDPALLGPPSVEFAPYGRIPNGKIRIDARQGTIDQDQEFIDFLESLTNPTIKPMLGEVGSDPESKKGEKVTVTPLIQYLRDKKANKGKETTSVAKPSKHVRQESKESKTSQGSEKKVATKNVKDASPPTDKRSAQAIKVEKVARDAVRLLSKQAISAQPPPPPPANPPATSPKAAPVGSTAPLAEKKRERGNASAAARILQRDLGIGAGAGGRRGGRREVAGPKPQAGTTQANAKPHSAVAQPEKITSDTSAAPASAAPPSVPSVASPDRSAHKPITIQPPTGPAASRSARRPSASSNSNPPSQGRPPVSTVPRPSPVPSTATQAFLKHANPSQGITEALLEEGFAGFGTIRKVEIDKKKGFAYIDFADPEALQKAIKASPVKIAQGQVVVLERKTGPTLQARNIRGGGGMIGNRGGGMPMNPRGGRGGSVRGRGALGRGGVGHSANGAPSTATTAATQGPSMGAATPATACATISADQSSAPTPSASATSTPAPTASGPTPPTFDAD